jgi:hypothetical protein
MARDNEAIREEVLSKDQKKTNDIDLSGCEGNSLYE